MSPAGWFVTGSDTGAGKTIVTAALAAALRERFGAVRVLKPVLSGAPAHPGDPPPLPDRADLGDLPDDRLLWEAAGRPGSLASVVLQRFDEPLAPSVAAARAAQRATRHGTENTGGGADTETVLRRLRESRESSEDPRLVEGVGGWRVWLDETRQVRDLAAACGLPVLVVIGNRLGAINHGTLTVEAVRADGFEPAAVLNHGAYPEDPEERTARAGNADELRKRLGCPVHEFPRLDEVDRAAILQRGTALLRALIGG